MASKSGCTTVLVEGPIAPNVLRHPSTSGIGDATGLSPAHARKLSADDREHKRALKPVVPAIACDAPGSRTEPTSDLGGFQSGDQALGPLDADVSIGGSINGQPSSLCARLP